MVEAPDHDQLDHARRRAGLSLETLWVRYFELGGLASVIELDAFLKGALVPARLERDILAHAINEELGERGLEERLGYAFDDPTDPDS